MYILIKSIVYNYESISYHTSEGLYHTENYMVSADIHLEVNGMVINMNIETKEYLESNQLIEHFKKQLFIND